MFDDASTLDVVWAIVFFVFFAYLMWSSHRSDKRFAHNDEQREQRYAQERAEYRDRTKAIEGVARAIRDHSRR